jgi:hypothetical protein
MAGFPTSADIERMSEQIEKARHAHPSVVQTTIVPPAIFREGRYVLQTRFVVWAEGGMDAARALEALIQNAGVRCRTVFPSGRALVATGVPSPREVLDVAPPAQGARASASTSGAKPRTSGPRPRVLPVRRGKPSRRSGPAGSTSKAGVKRGGRRIGKPAARRRGRP